MGRPKGKRKLPRNADGTIRKAPSPPADPAVGNDSPPSSDHEGANISPMHTNDHDDDWRDEDAGGEPGRGQAKLPFGSAVRSAASAAVSAAARTAMAVAPEVAPPARKNAVQPLHRSTQHRHRRARWSKEDAGMAGSLAAWLKPPAQQQEGQHGSPQIMETEGAVEMDVEVGVVGADSSDHDAEKICSPQEEHDRTSRGDSSESETDMLVCSGVGVPLEDWFGEDDQARAAELLYSSGEDSFLDALDASRDRSRGPGELDGESGDKADDDVQPQDTGEAEAVGDTGETAAVGGAGHAASSGTSGETVRKSSRTNLFDGLYADPARARDGARSRCSGPGRGTRVASGDAAKGRFAGLNKKRLKHRRREERKKTPEQRAREREARERARERTRERALKAQRRRENTPREKELLDIYQKVVDAIDKAEQSNSYSGFVEDPTEINADGISSPVHHAYRLGDSGVRCPRTNKYVNLCAEETNPSPLQQPRHRKKKTRTGLSYVSSEDRPDGSKVYGFHRKHLYGVMGILISAGITQKRRLTDHWGVGDHANYPLVRKCMPRDLFTLFYCRFFHMAPVIEALSKTHPEYDSKHHIRAFEDALNTC
ncbi:unnamed protein product [Ectocarpus sp. CCAP 1310/34]|nr:unnamed protein product [Ectocarpus sp. CCAP 1310/34]